jgi:hypothetical protein
MSTINLTGSYGTTPYKVSGLASGTVIDAETASWIQSNSGSGSNDYPFLVYNSPGAVLDGGTINGQTTRRASGAPCTTTHVGSALA